MASGTRIPRGIDLFNAYIVNTNAYLVIGFPTNASRLGILTAEQTQWNSFLTQWTPLYLKYSDKKNSRTTAVKDQMRAIIDDAVTFDQNKHLLDRIASSPNVTIVDMETFNIKKGQLQKTTRSVSVSSITEAVVAGIQTLGGGTLSVKCRSNTATRASIVEGADSVQYVYLVGKTAPTSYDAVGLTKEISTRAGFALNLGGEAAGESLYIYFRWYNTKHPELAGPWTGMQTVFIS